MTTTRPTRRYLIPTWLLVLVALAGIVGLLLTDPAGAVGAPLEEFPPPLPLDELPPTGPADGIAIACNVAAIVLLAGAILWGLAALRDRSDFVAWVRGPEAVAELRDRRGAEHMADLERHGFKTYTCGYCGGHAWSCEPGVTQRDLLDLHYRITPMCRGRLVDVG